jgi:hypothetical protein
LLERALDRALDISSHRIEPEGVRVFPDYRLLFVAIFPWEVEISRL